MVSIRSRVDLAKVFGEIQSGKKVILWCDGLKECSNQKRSRSAELDDDMNDEGTFKSTKPPASKKRKTEDKDERVQTTIEKLRERHSSMFTPIQIRIWSEMIVGGLHVSLDEPPTSSMFVKAGKGNNSGKKVERNSMTEAFTKAAVAISSALSPATLSPRNTPVNHSTISSPAKLIEARSKCYKQLNDLNGLRESGVLTEDEYIGEKDAVFEVLRKLKCDYV